MKYDDNNKITIGGGNAMKKSVLFAMAICLLGSQASAGGYYIPEQGVKAMGMGNAFSAVADDPSANWFNPAGLAFQANAVTAGGDLLVPNNEYQTGGQSYSAKKSIFIIPQTYLRYAAEDSKLSYGIGINSPFGLATDWTNSNAPFSQIAAGADSITFSQIEAIHVNPNIAYRFSDHFAIAVGVSYYNAIKVHLDNHALKIGGDGDGWGGNVAMLYKTDALSVGLSYRSRVKIDVKGTAVGGPAMALFGLNGIGANATTSFTIPDLFSGGVSFRPNEQWLVSVQVDWVNWKTFDQIDINFAPSLLNIATGPTTTVPENWKATTTFRVGAQWDYSDKMRARIGYVFDPTPTNSTDFSPRLPGADRQLATLGYSMDYSDNITLDMAYAYVWLSNRTVGLPTNPAYHGTYKSDVHVLAGSLTYRF